ncbi:nucleotidyltransferase substrate binding protein [Pontibacter sp. 172403-2]|uniref:nucleotidyltransferase substrate binding protein n=1 Tax=Pontibacter rufus TaxID=2791028 RepID=UPI0018AF8317|nr:nucleotidyltransferase substrate binding protein [Pontibacter sp. 172403-2]MBF9253622.1 nucleotidyltransferase substrate binding protein [Pontibacter sp. 172403-2]
MTHDIRWQQRFKNFSKAFAQLEKAVKLGSYSDLEREGLIQRFEYTYELAWKTLQDFLEYIGYVDVKGPRPVIEQAFKNGIIEDGNGWMAMKKSRELTSHTYDEDTARDIAAAILSRYYPLLKSLTIKLEAKTGNGPGAIS